MCGGRRLIYMEIRFKTMIKMKNAKEALRLRDWVNRIGWKPPKAGKLTFCGTLRGSPLRRRPSGKILNNAVQSEMKFGCKSHRAGFVINSRWNLWFTQLSKNASLRKGFLWNMKFDAAIVDISHSSFLHFLLKRFSVFDTWAPACSS